MYNLQCRIRFPRESMLACKFVDGMEAFDGFSRQATAVAFDLPMSDAVAAAAAADAASLPICLPTTDDDRDPASTWVLPD